MIFIRKINKVPEFYTVFAREMTEFYVIIARKKFSRIFDFFWVGARVLCPLSPRHLRLWSLVVVSRSAGLSSRRVSASRTRSL